MIKTSLLKLFLSGLISLTLNVSQQAKAAQISPEDFGMNAITEDYEGLELDDLGNVTPLDINGNIYDTDDNQLIYGSNLGDRIGRSGAAPAINNDLGFIDIVLASPVFKAGAWVGTSLDMNFTAEFFDSGDTLLGSLNLSSVANNSTFAGWGTDSDLIKRIRFTDLASNERRLIWDDLITEASEIETTPEPKSVLSLLGLGLLAGGSSLRRKKIWLG